MKPEEAIEKLQAKLTCMKLEQLSCIEKGCSRNCDNCEYNYKQGTMGEQEEALRTAIEALKEAQQYREIGTVEECREAVEKQKPKKPETIERDFDYYKCPVCGEYIWATDNINSHKYCLNCGQKIEMEESE